MKTTLFITVFPLLLIMLFFINGCNKEADQDDFDFFADVFLVKKKINGEVKTANSYYVYGNSFIEYVIVIPPENSGSPVSLTAIDDMKLNYSYDPDSSDFNLVPPISGNYIFEIKNKNGEKIQKTDVLKVGNLAIPEIDTVVYNKTTLSLNVKWHKLTDSDALFVKLFNKEDNLIYISPALAGSVTEFRIVTGDGNWISSASPGDELMVQIQSVIIEENADINYSLYNIEGTAIAEKTVSWGELESGF